MKRQYSGIVNIGQSVGQTDVWLRESGVTITPIYMLEEFKGKYVMITIEDETPAERMLFEALGLKEVCSIGQNYPCGCDGMA